MPIDACTLCTYPLPITNGSTTNNSERGKQVQFAIDYFYTGTRFLVKTGTQVTTRTTHLQL